MNHIIKKDSILGETLDSFESKISDAGFAKYRATQVFEWIYKKRVNDWELMHNIPKDLKEWLDEKYEINASKIVLSKSSNDVTQKYLIQLKDKQMIETVLISAPQEGVGIEKSRRTVCVSIQVGCAYGCRFCASGLLGFKRNLEACEVVAQLLHMSKRQSHSLHKKKENLLINNKSNIKFDNIVFMGMGEPLANYDNLVRALKIINAPWGLNIGARRITISTSGLAPQIEKLASENLPVRLAISLHGATNEVRDRIMPINKRFPLEKLIKSAEIFQKQHGRMLTLEFILIEGVNDTHEQAKALSKIARQLHAHVNCIPYNRVDGLEWNRPSINRQDSFVKILKKARVSVTIRREKGHSINAACGQLKLKTEFDLAKNELTPRSAFRS